MPKTPKQHPPGPHPKEVERVAGAIVEMLEHKLEHSRQQNNALDETDIAVAVQRVAERFAEFLPEE